MAQQVQNTQWYLGLPQKILSAFRKCDDLEEFITKCKNAGIGGAYVSPRGEIGANRRRGKRKKIFDSEFGIDIRAAWDRKYNYSIDLTEEINVAARGTGGDGFDFKRAELLLNEKAHEFGDELSSKGIVPVYEKFSAGDRFCY